MSIFRRIESQKPILAVPLLLAVFAGCAVSADESADSEEKFGEVQSALNNAPLDTEHTFSVGICSGGLRADGTCASLLCSGTLVAPNVVLTAQHCVNSINYAEKWCDSTFGGRNSTNPIRITTSDSVRDPNPVWHDVREVLVPEANVICHDDVALLYLSTPVPKEVARPVAISVFRDIDRLPPAAVAIVGRGLVDSLIDPVTKVRTTSNGGYKRRILEDVPVVCTPGSAAGCDVVDYTSPPTNMFNVPASMFAIGGSIESGDSGSAIFDQASFGTFPSVIGVASASTRGPDGKVNTAIITRVDTHRKFIVRGVLKGYLELYL